MPSHLHEILIQMFKDRPALAAEILDGPLCVDVPEFDEALFESVDRSAVVTLHRHGSPVMGIVIEVQQGIEPHRRHAWPARVGRLHARLGCPVALLVMCPDEAVARWCAAPIAIGPPGTVVTPLTLGLRQAPAVTDPRIARLVPELTVWSALVHGDGAEGVRVLETLPIALDAIGPSRATLYADLVLSRLPPAPRKSLEDLMTLTGHRHESDLARRYFDQGVAEGEARAVLTVLAARGVDVPETVRAAIAGCTDVDQLGTWIRLAATAQKIEDVTS